jgi:hypothetical protein
VNFPVIISFFLSFNAMAGFSGDWDYEDGSHSMNLELFEDSGEVLGSYCFITNSGNRIDCANKDEVNIKGTVINKVGQITFESTFGGTGKATIEINSDLLTYTITDHTPFVEANMSVPHVIIFNKRNK